MLMVLVCRYSVDSSGTNLLKQDAGPAFTALYNDLRRLNFKKVKTSGDNRVVYEYI